jgi:hypothetical protein
MADIDNILLEHLVALRNELKEFRQEAREELQIIKMRLNSVERTVSGAHDDNVIVQMRLDKVDEKIDNIEKRLELSAA